MNITIETQLVAIAKAIQSLRKAQKADLKAMVHGHYRVCDTSTADKWTLIGMILRARFGQKALEAYDALPAKERKQLTTRV